MELTITTREGAPRANDGKRSTVRRAGARWFTCMCCSQPSFENFWGPDIKKFHSQEILSQGVRRFDLHVRHGGHQKKLEYLQYHNFVPIHYSSMHLDNLPDVVFRRKPDSWLLNECAEAQTNVKDKGGRWIPVMQNIPALLISRFSGSFRASQVSPSVRTDCKERQSSSITYTWE